MEGLTEEVQEKKTPVPGNEIRKLIHELNNQLTLVIGWGQLLLLNEGAPEMKEELARIVEAAKKASQVAGDILSFAKSN